MDLDDIALFRTITLSHSLSAAARQLGMTPMAVSRRLAGLEARLAVRLFHRTTRSLTLTPEGEAFLPHAVSMIEARDAGIASVTGNDAGLTGVLKVTAPNVIGHSIVVPVITELMAQNPLLQVDLTLSDGVVDITTTGLDVAIRVSPLEPSELIASKLADNPRILCASPSYLERFGRPDTIADLINHPCLKLHGIDAWPFRIDGEVARVRAEGPFSANTVDAIRAACGAHAGIAMMTYWDVRHLLLSGQLEQLTLEGAKPDSLAIGAVVPSRKQVPPRVRSFTAALKTLFLQRAKFDSDGEQYLGQAISADH